MYVECMIFVYLSCDYVLKYDIVELKLSAYNSYL
jgi:hypothetical protein